jgi:hypothetical protein
MKKLPVDLSELQIAFESQDGGLGLHTYWFDTGPASERGCHCLQILISPFSPICGGQHF